MKVKIPLKDILFNRAKVEQIAKEIHRVHPVFNRRDFVRDVIATFPELELKARIFCIAESLRKYLPGSYRTTVAILVKALPPPNCPHLSDDDFGDFIYAPYGHYIAQNGCSKEHLQLSLNALYEITQRFSVEDAIRYFLNAFPKETLKELSSWTNDQHYHVRRLCSEGTRPKLPWSQKINISIAAPISILDKLFSDGTRYVTRSVANHINDISKTSPDLAIDTLKRWQESGEQDQKEMGYIVGHALRTLVKQGNLEALTMLGFNHAPRVRLSKVVVPKKVKMNSALEFSFVIYSEEDTAVIIDYILHFRNRSGNLNGRKVFKLTKLTLVKNKPFVVSKCHILREQMTTRKLFPGRHEIGIQINGKVFGKKAFQLM